MSSSPLVRFRPRPRPPRMPSGTGPRDDGRDMRAELRWAGRRRSWRHHCQGSRCDLQRAPVPTPRFVVSAITGDSPPVAIRTRRAVHMRVPGLLPCVPRRSRTIVGRIWALPSHGRRRCRAGRRPAGVGCHLQPEGVQREVGDEKLADAQQLGLAVARDAEPDSVKAECRRESRPNCGADVGRVRSLDSSPSRLRGDPTLTPSTARHPLRPVRCGYEIDRTGDAAGRELRRLGQVEWDARALERRCSRVRREAAPAQAGRTAGSPPRGAFRRPRGGRRGDPGRPATPRQLGDALREMRLDRGTGRPECAACRIERRCASVRPRSRCHSRRGRGGGPKPARVVSQ